MTLEQFKKLELAKEIEDVYNAICDGIFDELLIKRYKHETSFQNRTEIMSVLARMCTQLADEVQ